MDNARVDEVLRTYDAALEAAGWRIKRAAAGELVPIDESVLRAEDVTMEHARWMCREALSWGPERLEKKFRWLGFIQGALWSMGLYTVDELKADNMPSPEP